MERRARAKGLGGPAEMSLLDLLEKRFSYRALESNVRSHALERCDRHYSRTQSMNQFGRALPPIDMEFRGRQPPRVFAKQYDSKNCHDARRIAESRTPVSRDGSGSLQRKRMLVALVL